MLNDKDIEKLCQGRIIKASVYNSSGTDAAGPHYAVILDTDEQVAEHDSYYAAVISHNDQIDPEFIIPVPSRTGISGFIVGSWQVEVHLPAITEIGARLLKPEMLKVLDLVRRASASKANGKRSTRS
jgi:hypothetical protein